MRLGFGVIAALSLAATSSRAEPRFEASGFFGVGHFPTDGELGNSWAAEQIPGTGTVFGARLAYLVPGNLAEAPDMRLRLALEAELALETSSTGSHGSRMSYFAPVFGWRAHAQLRLDRWTTFTPFLVAGGGGETIASSSPFMEKETDPVVYYGPGVLVPISDSWQIRVDLRHGIMAARGGGTTSTIEGQLGFSTSFDLPVRKMSRWVPPPPEQPVVDETDRDGDGIPDRLDRCPADKETVNGIDDGDGCPEADLDGDGILGDADKCPSQAEDFDKFEDGDGCPDPDNDHDGMEDAHDACPDEAETVNGFEDDDGCPDQVPADVTKPLAAATRLAFEPNRARVTDQAKKLLAPVLVMLRAHPRLRIEITGHPDGAAGEDLAKRRGDAVRWHLVDEGIARDRIETRVGAVGKVPAIEITLLANGQ